MNKTKQTFLRLALALVVGMTVTAAALSTLRAGAYIHTQHSYAVRDLKSMAAAIATYQRDTGTLPTSLGQLRSSPEARVPFQDDGNVKDPWGNLYIYERKDNSYSLLTFGRDGKPGGIGWDCDLNSTNPNPPEAKIPFWQLVTDPLLKGMVYTSLISGLLTFLLVFSTVTSIDLRLNRLALLIVQLGVTLIGAAFIAMFITIMHVPSGH